MCGGRRQRAPLTRKETHVAAHHWREELQEPDSMQAPERARVRRKHGHTEPGVDEPHRRGEEGDLERGLGVDARDAQALLDDLAYRGSALQPYQWLIGKVAPRHPRNAR